ncbi:hypothetical protein IJG72_01590 [bacterium]|nr:hypothetical protein [bacterium]
MVRIMRYRYVLMLICVNLFLSANAQDIAAPIELETNTTPYITVKNDSLSAPQNISFDKCTKKYMIPVESLFYHALAGINANKFTIDEIQSKNGYIVFTAANKKFLASVNRVDATSTILKITPTDGIYFFPVGVISNLFKYIDVNKDAKIEQISD